MLGKSFIRTFRLPVVKSRVGLARHERGLSIIETLIAAAIISVLAVGITSQVKSFYSALKASENIGEIIDLRLYLKRTFSCEETLNAPSTKGRCMNGDYVATRRADSSIQVARAPDITTIGQDIDVRAHCSHVSGEFYQFDFEYRRTVGNGAPTSWKSIFNGIPTFCGSPGTGPAPKPDPEPEPDPEQACLLETTAFSTLFRISVGNGIMTAGGSTESSLKPPSGFKVTLGGGSTFSPCDGLSAEITWKASPSLCCTLTFNGTDLNLGNSGNMVKTLNGNDSFKFECENGYGYTYHYLKCMDTNPYKKKKYKGFNN